jgi:hypothetical protein
VRPEVTRGERAHEARTAARAWRRADVIDDATLVAIETAYADDRVRARFVFRLLFFIFTAFAVFTAFGLMMVVGFDSSDTFGIVALMFAGLCIILTEIQTGPMRRDRGGTEEATAFTAVVFLLLGVFWFVHEMLRQESYSVRLTLVLVLFTAILAAASWRWAHLSAAVAAAVCAFWLLARAPFGRWLWAIAGVLAIVPLLRASVSARLAPSHRRACAGVLVIALLALYAAVSIWSFDQGVVERIGDRAPGFWGIFSGTGEPATEGAGPSWSVARIVHLALTTLVPLALIVTGFRTRRRILLDTGGILAGLTLVTIRAYWHLGETWLVLALAGAALIAIALALHRRLDRGPGKELRGFTAEPLFASVAHGHALKVAATLAAFAPAGRRLPAEEPGVEGRGGASGGAGAGGEL